MEDINKIAATNKSPLGGLGVIINPNKTDWPDLLKRPAFETAQLNETVKAVLDEIKADGDKAVKKYTTQFDKVELDELQVSNAEIEEGIATLDKNLKNAIETATANISKFFNIILGITVRKP